MVPIVRLLMLVSTPISWPIAKLLDLVLGEGHAATRFNRRQIRTLINLHLQSKHRQHAHVSGAVDFKSSHNPGPGLSEDEVTIVGETLKLASKTVGGIMTPLEEVCMLPEDTCFDENTLADVLGYGHSRIPVFRGRRENIVGLAEVKEGFSSPKLGDIAGSIVTEGYVKRSNPIRVLRDKVVIDEGELEARRPHERGLGSRLTILLSWSARSLPLRRSWRPPPRATRWWPR